MIATYRDHVIVFWHLFVRSTSWAWLGVSAAGAETLWPRSSPRTEFVIPNIVDREDVFLANTCPHTWFAQPMVCAAPWAEPCTRADGRDAGVHSDALSFLASPCSFVRMRFDEPPQRAFQPLRLRDWWTFLRSSMLPVCAIALAVCVLSDFCQGGSRPRCGMVLFLSHRNGERNELASLPGLDPRRAAPFWG